MAVRVPLLNASMTDCVFEIARPTTADEVNGYLKAAADGELYDILGFEPRPLVSVDFLNDPRSSIVDGEADCDWYGGRAEAQAVESRLHVGEDCADRDPARHREENP
jgi:glyceraldehyde-3-phosphate dehydrogenase/erythrose-4-phosphate dehydrogenase